MRSVRPLVAPAVALVVLGGTSGCASFAYVAQAAQGQLELAEAARPIDSVLTDPETPPRTAALLREVEPIKRYGERQGLRPGSSYTTFAEVDGPAVVWVVSASAPLAFRSRWWWFPIVGSMSYLGWFERGDADEHAERLRAAGWDADVGGATAYSTLGWFSDPVLSTMLSDDDDALGELASTVLHESAHATFYLRGAPELNESLAELVGDTLAEGYLDERAGPTSPDTLSFVRHRRGRRERDEAKQRTYALLEALYASPLPTAQKLAKKAALLEALEAEIGATRPLNNASLIQAKTYVGAAMELETLFAACGRAWPRVFGALGAWARTRPDGEEDPRAALLRLAHEGCR